jgi:hypothetical protein
MQQQGGRAMRDDEDIRQYMPVLRRIIILVAVLTAIPVVMWTITAFVRTYVGPPRAPNYQPMAAKPPASNAPDQMAAAPPDNAVTASIPAAPQPVVVAKVNTPPTATDAISAGPPPASSMTTAPAGGSTGALPADASLQNTAAGPSASDGTQRADVAAPSATDSAPPNPLPYDSTQAPPQQEAAPQQQVAEQQPDATAWPAAPAPATADDALPQGAPIAGPVPLPHKRPTSFVVAQSTIPLPMPRPDAAGPGEQQAAPNTPLDWLHHIFQPSSGAAAAAPDGDSDGYSETPH